MPNVTKKRIGEFLLVVFEFIWDKPDGLRVKEILDRIPQKITLTEWEKGFYPSSPGEKRYVKNIRFGSIDLVKAGWLVKSKGIWTITDDGRQAYQKYKDPEVFYKEAVRLYHQWDLNRPTDEELEEGESEIPNTFLAIEEAEEKAWTQITQFLAEMPPYEFQELVADLIRAMDYHVEWIAPQGRDQGIDIIAYNDPLGAVNPRIKIQVKHRNQSTTVEGLRSFISVLGNDEIGIFVSFGGFTSEAKEKARTEQNRKVTLIDLERFYDLWIEHYQNLSQEAQQRFPLKPVYFLSPNID
jgi:restriction system protein